MLEFFEEFSGIRTPRELMKSIVSPFFGESVSDNMLNMLLAQYQVYAKTATWDELRPNLNTRMKQFAREERYIRPTPTEATVAAPIRSIWTSTWLYKTVKDMTEEEFKEYEEWCEADEDEHHVEKNEWRYR